MPRKSMTLNKPRLKKASAKTMDARRKSSKPRATPTGRVTAKRTRPNAKALGTKATASARPSVNVPIAPTADTSTHECAPEGAAAGRERVLREHVVPHVKQMLAKRKSFNSAVLLVAQYIDDEVDAEDAVHHLIAWSEEDVPPPIGPWLATALKTDVDPEAWDAEGAAIPLFAAFTKEGCDQHMQLHESYAPFAVFTRSGRSVEPRVIGTMMRPWLDGAAPMADHERDDTPEISMLVQQDGMEGRIEVKVKDRRLHQFLERLRRSL